MITSFKSFGSLTPEKVELEADALVYKYLSFRDVDGIEWQDLVAQFGPFDFYISVTDEGRIVSMESDPDATQIADLEIIGINVSEDFNFTNGPGGTIYGKVWDGSTVIDPALTPIPADVDRERDRRIDGGFSFGGVVYQTRSEDRENIAGAKSAATDAIALGAQSGDFGWQQMLDPALPDVFGWIAADNSVHPMDAQTMVQFAYAALAHKQAHIFAARSLKDADPIPVNFADDAYWPVAL